MTQSLLHLDSSFHAPNVSVSRQLTALFAQTWQDTHGAAGYTYRDLGTEPVTPVGPAYDDLCQRAERLGGVSAERVPELAANPAEELEWLLTRPLVEELIAADTVVLGVPMHNFTIPATLKAWIDRVTFPGVFTEHDVEGAHTLQGNMLRGTRVVIVAARGGGYGPGTPRAAFDFQTPYLRAYFTNLGVREPDLHFVQAEMTRADTVVELARFKDFAATSLAEARAAVVSLAAGATNAHSTVV